MKYVKKEYEVLSGEVENKYCPALRQVETRSSPIILPHEEASHDTRLPPAKIRYKMIKYAQEQGMTIGTEVIRVIHITPAYLSNPRMIGRISRFIFHIFPGVREYKPILVRFTNSDGSHQEFAFSYSELETVENAKKQLKLFSATTKSLEEAVLEDVLKERNGVIPFRKTATILRLPHKGD